MVKFVFIVSATFLFCNVLGQRRDNNVVLFENETSSRSNQNDNSLLSGLAQEIIRRSANSTQVLNLNLSNLLLILLLKAIVYGAGYVGNHALKGRGDIAEDNVLSEGEIALALGYLLGDTCLYRAACEVPHTAKEYLGAAEMILQMTKLMPQSIAIDESYEIIMMEIEKAVNLGLKGQCPSNYHCKKENINRFLRPQ